MKQNGFILIVSLIFLAIMTMLGIAMFRGITMDEMMSGNQREKSRSIDAAQTTLNTAQNWLANPVNTVLGGTLNPGVNCTAATPQPAICTNVWTPTVLATPTSWPYFASSVPTGMTVNTAGGLNTYYSQPQYYIQFLGFIPGSTNSAFYQVTAAAQGGNSTATAVVQTVYQVTATSRDISGG